MKLSVLAFSSFVSKLMCYPIKENNGGQYFADLHQDIIFGGTLAFCSMTLSNAFVPTPDKCN
jgi:hypothetical protein